MLVTGATGFLGGHVVRRLLSRGAYVKALGRNPDKAQELITLGADFYPVDIWWDPAPIKNLCRDIDMVIHCGGLTTAWANKTQFYQVNTLGTRNVVAACLNARVQRLVHLSSSSIYCNGQDRLNIQEKAALPRRFINTYAWSKYLADQHVQYGIAQGLSAIILRPKGIFGPGENTLLPRLLAASQGGGIPLINRGQALIDTTYVDNVMDAIELALLAPQEACGQVFNISNAQPMAVVDLLGRLFEAIGQPLRLQSMPYAWALAMAYAEETRARVTQQEPRFTRFMLEWLAHSQTLAIEKARHWLGYKPALSVSQGIQHYAQHWLEVNALDKQVTTT